MKIWKRALVMLAALGLVSGLGACSVAATGTEAQAIRYSGGALDVENFKNCEPKSVRNYGDPGDKVYYYPVNQRNFTFSDNPAVKNDSPPIKVTTSDRQEVTIRGTITFSLTDDCATLRKFHEEIGKRKNAYFEDPDNMDEDPGWSDFLGIYFTTNVNNIMDAAGLKSTVEQLYTNKTVQDNFETEVVKTLAAEINKQVGQGVIKIDTMAIERPQPDAKLLESWQSIEKARADSKAKVEAERGAGQAEVEKVKQQKLVQAEKNALAREAVQARKQCLEVYTQAQCANLELAQTPGAKIYVLPDGTKFRLDERGTKTE